MNVVVMSVVAPKMMSDPASRAEIRAWIRYINIVRVAGFVAILCAPFSLWVLFWSSPGDYPFLSSMVWVPAVTYGCVLLFNRVWRKDRFAKLLFGAGIALRLVAAGAFLWVGFSVYDAAIDAFRYWSVGLAVMDQ